jgi:ribosomal protein L23
MKTDPLYIIKRPVITEEATLQTKNGNHYVFRVDFRANKHQIRDAIESMFPNVKVVSVNTMNYQGKWSRIRGRRNIGRRAKWKKAIVKLQQGHSIDLI